MPRLTLSIAAVFLWTVVTKVLVPSQTVKTEETNVSLITRRHVEVVFFQQITGKR